MTDSERATKAEEIKRAAMVARQRRLADDEKRHEAGKALRYLWGSFDDCTRAVKGLTVALNTTHKAPE